MSLMALARYPTRFKLACAGAAVTRWELYDTAYTERYLGLPEKNETGYAAGSILTYVDSIPEE